MIVHTTHLECDRCGFRTPTENLPPEELVKQAERFGWERRITQHFCQACTEQTDSIRDPLGVSTELIERLERRRGKA